MFEVNIDGKSVGKSHKPFIIAEMSGNHNQSESFKLKKGADPKLKES